MQRLDNEGTDLGGKGSTEDQWVSFNGSNDLLLCPWDVDGDLVGNCGDKGFGVTAVRDRNERRRNWRAAAFPTRSVPRCYGRWRTCRLQQAHKTIE